MDDSSKQTARRRKSSAYRELARTLARAEIYRPTPQSIFDCLTTAQLQEGHARSSQLSRRELARQSPGADVPEELSDAAVAKYLASAAGLYGAAAAKCLRIPDLDRAYKYYRRAWRDCRSAAALQPSGSAELEEEARGYADKTAVVRQRLARRSLCRRRLSLGLWR
jgi:hypothetical protein